MPDLQAAVDSMVKASPSQYVNAAKAKRCAEIAAHIESDMTVHRVLHSGAIICAVVIFGERESCTFYDSTESDARADFVADLTESLMDSIVFNIPAQES